MGNSLKTEAMLLPIWKKQAVIITRRQQEDLYHGPCNLNITFVTYRYKFWVPLQKEGRHSGFSSAFLPH
jgi:hypothetical protein